MEEILDQMKHERKRETSGQEIADQIQRLESLIERRFDLIIPALFYILVVNALVLTFGVLVWWLK